MAIRIIETTPFDDQRPGTSGLRTKARVFAEQPHDLENFVQAVFDTLGGVEGARFVQAATAVGSTTGRSMSACA